MRNAKLERLDIKQSSIFAWNLRRILNEQRVSAAALSKSLGFNSDAINNYIRCRTEPEYGTIRLIAKALGASVHELLDPPGMNDDEVLIYALERRLGEHNMPAIVKIEEYLKKYPRTEATCNLGSR